MTSARALSDRLAQLLRLEHVALGDFLVALAAFDRERRWVELGHSSLFYFLHRELGLSAGAAQYRKTAAELIQRYPQLEEPLRDGRLCLMSVCELARVLTQENLDEVLPRFFHRSRREAREIAVEIRPEVAPRREIVAAVPRATPFQLVEMGCPGGSPTANPTATAMPTTTATGTLMPIATGIPAATRPVRDAVEPVTADLRRLHVTVSRRLLAKLEAARDGLSHSLPCASTEQVLEAALDALLAKQAARKGLVTRPRAPAAAASPVPGLAVGPVETAGASTGRAHIPARVKREVWTRDGGRCQWPLEAGGVCGATRSLELDHVVPLARGGLPTTANLRVLCRFHNQLAARHALGDALMDRFAAGR